MSQTSVRKVMYQNQINQMDKNDKEYIRLKIIEFKKLLNYGRLHRIAFEMAQIEIELENEQE